ncbi:MAG: GNAT family N-acetyltransferase [Alphaproteobacteria bacterium]|nr:GNAT family N-acetyltransferase [Alphaproteobacteria bacterium]
MAEDSLADGRRLSVRSAGLADAASIVRLVCALAAYEHVAQSDVRLTEAEVLRAAFGARPEFEVLLAERDGLPVGFALFFQSYSTFAGGPCLYLEDLFVEETSRGLGLGRRLLRELARLCLQRRYLKLDLSVLDWNPTRALYHRIGFRQREGWLPYRLDGEGIVRLANS